MKLYQTNAYHKDEGRMLLWSGSQADAAKDRKTLKEDAQVISKPKTEVIDVPTNKKDLLLWLNQRLNRDNG